MEIRYAANPVDVKSYDTQKLREQFLVEDLFQPGKIKLVYSHYDRLIIGGIMPIKEALVLSQEEALKTDYFFERREGAFINIGGPAVLTVDGENDELNKLDGLYVSRGTKQVSFVSKDATNPAKLYFTSAAAHADYPTTKMAMEEATPLHLGASETSNERTIYQYVHADGTRSCQLMLGVTILKKGSVWNTMPAHVHDRRMEAYLYLDLKDDEKVFHFMGEPQETRHIVVSNEQAVISPSWSIHSGAGTSNYTFIWAMAGENYTFKDMESIDMSDLK